MGKLIATAGYWPSQTGTWADTVILTYLPAS
jgi:hypothetical protein